MEVRVDEDRTNQVVFERRVLLERGPGDAWNDLAPGEREHHAIDVSGEGVGGQVGR